MIEVRQLVKNFSDFRALDGLNLSVPRGSIYGLVGPNGAGKTTVLRHIVGAMRPDSGTIEIDGSPVYERPEVKERIASILDDVFYFSSASTRDMMAFYRGLYPHFDVELYGRLRDAFPEINENTPIRRLSKGMQKQSAFWLALSCRPDVVILDEPVDGLDPIMRRQVWSLLVEEVSQREITVLVSSHNLRELEDVCDHVGILSHGRVLLERSLSELQEDVVKLQIAFPDPGTLPELPKDLQVLHVSSVGRFYTLIVRGSVAEVESRMADYHPILMEAVPLTLEEIFIYELGDENYEIHDILL